MQRADGRRASDRRRERTVAALADGYAAGALGADTLSWRVDAAYTARTEGELRALVADLPLRRWWDRARAWLAGAPSGAEPPVVRVAPPPDGPGPWIIGRDRRCRLVLDVRTVSRVHAELRRAGEAWEVRDLGSTNGTWVNGWRVERATVGPEDALSLGDVRVVLGP